MADNEMVTNANDEADEAEAKSKESVKAAVAGLFALSPPIIATRRRPSSSSTIAPSSVEKVVKVVDEQQQPPSLLPHRNKTRSKSVGQQQQMPNLSQQTVRKLSSTKRKKIVSNACSVDECGTRNGTSSSTMHNLAYRFYALPGDPNLAWQWICLSKSNEHERNIWWKQYCDASDRVSHRTSSISRFCPFHICERHFVDGKPTQRNQLPSLFIPDTRDSDSSSHTVAHINSNPNMTKSLIRFTSSQSTVVNKCIIRECPVRSDLMHMTERRPYRLFRMPTDENERASWISSIRRCDVNAMISNDRDCFVCERHFPGGIILKDGKRQIPMLSMSIDANRKCARELPTEPVAADDDHSGQSNIRCLVRCCPITQGMIAPSKKPYQFYLVPKNGLARSKWFDAMFCEDVDFKVPQTNGDLFVCERHFVHMGPNRSPHTVVPTLFLNPTNSAHLAHAIKSGNTHVTSSGATSMAVRRVASSIAPHRKAKFQHINDDNWCCRDIPALKNSIGRLTSRVDTLYVMVCHLYKAAGFEVPTDDTPVDNNDIVVNELSTAASVNLESALNDLKQQVHVHRTVIDQQMPNDDVVANTPIERHQPDDANLKRKLIKPGPLSFKKRKMAELKEMIRSSGSMASAEFVVGEDLSSQFTKSAHEDDNNSGLMESNDVDNGAHDPIQSVTESPVCSTEELSPEQIVPYL